MDCKSLERALREKPDSVFSRVALYAAIPQRSRFGGFSGGFSHGDARATPLAPYMS
jgi:hypothetical protein